MAKPVKNPVAKMSPAAPGRATAPTREIPLEMNLQELRQRCADLSQGDVARLLDVTQGFVSRFERRDDVLLSTLYGYIEALGGVLELRARFPDREDVRVTQFEPGAADAAALRGKACPRARGQGAVR